MVKWKIKFILDTYEVTHCGNAVLSTLRQRSGPNLAGFVLETRESLGRSSKDICLTTFRCQKANNIRDGLRENSIMLIMLSQLRDRVSFCLSLCLVKDAEELEN